MAANVDLIIDDIVTEMKNYVPIQPDIDPSNIMAAELQAQNLDIKRIVKKDILNRMINPVEAYDLLLVDAVTAPLCYFTFSRLYLGFDMSYADGGADTETDKDVFGKVKEQGNYWKSIAIEAMGDLIDLIEDEHEGDNKQIDESKMVSRIRVIGGHENRASN